jgi:hypothetical protein
MPGLRIDAGRNLGWLDIGSYARRGPGRRDHLNPGQVELIVRTVRRTPEVMVKMLNRGGQDVRAVARHLKYLDRNGELEIETDEGTRLRGQGTEKEIIDDWDLGIDESRGGINLGPRGRPAPKLVQKILFSMPPGTPPDKVLAAVKDFAREEFALKHRYAMVLHTDEPHPHVHLVVKALGDDGKRLNIRRATLRTWRAEFATHLRAHGIMANATDRTVRGVTKPQKTDGIYRAAARGQSTHWRERVQAALRMRTTEGHSQKEPVKRRLLETHGAVVRGWREIAKDLERADQNSLADAVRRYANTLPLPRAESEYIYAQIRRSQKDQRGRREVPER